MSIFRWVFWGLLRLVLGARYRLRVHGKEQLRALKGPVLILPNHPGYIDPFLLFAALWPSLRMRPLDSRQLPLLHAAPPRRHDTRGRRALPAAGAAPRGAQPLARGVVQPRLERRGREADLGSLPFPVRPAHLRLRDLSEAGRR